MSPTWYHTLSCSTFETVLVEAVSRGAFVGCFFVSALRDLVVRPFFFVPRRAGTRVTGQTRRRKRRGENIPTGGTLSCSSSCSSMPTKPSAPDSRSTCPSAL
uniref:Uncharacterized protein n=1 Tax=Anopheles coluzzii TaxID=1518534 RepID=A0A8W7PDC7_ANOCL